MSNPKLQIDPRDRAADERECSFHRQEIEFPTARVRILMAEVDCIRDRVGMLADIVNAIREKYNA